MSEFVATWKPTPPEFRKRLNAALALPCPENLNVYAPELSYGRHFGPPTLGARHGAVLVLLYPANGDWQIVLTERTSHLSSHAGQISFPGGRIEPGESPEQAARREYVEELGEPGPCEILGRLTDLNVYASNFLVTPVVAVAQQRPAYAPNPHEVAEVLELPLAAIGDPALRGRQEIVRGPLRFRTPHLSFAGRAIWGATWIMLGELWCRLHANEAHEVQPAGLCKI